MRESIVLTNIFDKKKILVITKNIIWVKDIYDNGEIIEIGQFGLIANVKRASEIKLIYNEKESETIYVLEPLEEISLALK